MSQIGHNQKPYVSVESLTEDQKRRLRDTVVEVADSLMRQSSERDLQKDEIDATSKELGVDKKLIRRMAKVWFKQNYAEDQEEQEKFTSYYDEVMNDKTP